MTMRLFYPFLLLLCYVSLAAQVTIPYTNFPKNIDGQSDDWHDEPPVEAAVENLLLADTSFDNHISVRLAWDEQNLYGLVQITDQRLIKLRSGNDNPTLNLNDAVELYIDPLNDSHATMDVNDYQFIMDIGNDLTILKGDKHLMADEWRAPKDAGSATIVFPFKTTLDGSLNRETDRDQGWYLEFALPWAAVGIRPGVAYRFRMDVCFDDMDRVLLLDTIPENAVIPAYTCMSWMGSRDFSFPPQWPECQLVGSPNSILAFGKHYWAILLPLALVLLLATLGLIAVLWRKINRLKTVPVREDLKKGLMAPWLDARLPEQPGQEQALFEQLRNYILANLHHDLSPDDLARQAHLSVRQLQRLFRESLDCTPHQFILMLKMEQAPLLLRQNRQQVSETAYALGFSDPGYFSKVFRKYHGVAPRDFE